MLKSPSFPVCNCLSKLDEARLIAISYQQDPMVPGEFRGFTSGVCTANSEA